MDKLLRYDVHDQIKLVDIYSAEFNLLAPEVNKGMALSVIHGIYQNKVIQGIDVNYWAWSLVGKKHWVVLLRTPVTRQLAKLGYVIFARNRHLISSICSKLFKLNAKQCANGYCHAPHKTPNHRR